MKTRYSTKLQIHDKKYMSPLIGFKGCNIKRIVHIVNDKCYIKAENDGITFTISACNKYSMIKAYTLLEIEYNHLKNPAIKSLKPHMCMEIENSIAKNIIGKNGSRLKSIMECMGNGCYLVYIGNTLHIYANNNNTLSMTHMTVKYIINQFKLNKAEISMNNSIGLSNSSHSLSKLTQTRPTTEEQGPSSRTKTLTAHGKVLDNTSLHIIEPNSPIKNIDIKISDCKDYSSDDTLITDHATMNSLDYSSDSSDISYDEC